MCGRRFQNRAQHQKSPTCGTRMAMDLNSNLHHEITRSPQGNNLGRKATLNHYPFPKLKMWNPFFGKSGKCGIRFLEKRKMWNSFLAGNENVELIFE
jgi:hypothetical protein